MTKQTVNMPSPRSLVTKSLDNSAQIATARGLAQGKQTRAMLIATHATIRQPDNGVSAETRDMLQSQAVKDAIAGLKKLQVATERTATYKVVKYIEERYWEWYCCNGCWHRRLCIRRRPVYEERTRTYTSQEKAFANRTIFDDPTRPEIGEHTAIIDLDSLPSAAGGRASKVAAILQRHLPSNTLATAPQREDRALAIESRDFSSDGAPAGEQRKFRVLVSVDANNADRKIRLTVMVAQRGAADQILEKNKNALNQIAEQIGLAAAADFKK